MSNFLTIKEAVGAYSSGCDAKTGMPVSKLLLRAVLAGMMIAMGAAGGNVAAHALGNVGLARMVAASVFPVGLMMVVLTGSELFTGDCLMVIGTADGRHTAKKLCAVLTMVYLGNFVGGALTALGMSLCGQFDYSGGLLGAYTIKVALGKVNLSFMQALVSGVLCNILVSLAVIMALCAKDIAGKLLACFFVIYLFVVAGFEHCVANMYYITAGMLAAAQSAYAEMAMSAYGLNAGQLAQLNMGSFLFGNLLPVTIGNIVGGMLCVGLPLWYVTREEKR